MPSKTTRWCRAELWCRLLSNKVDTSVVVVYTPTEAEFMFPLDWQHHSVAEGNFTVEADRSEVVRLGELAVESKIRHLRDKGPLNHYRFYSALRPKLLNQQREDRDADSFLRQFRFDSIAQAVQDTSNMNAVMCAALSGDTGMLRLLAERRANMNHVLYDMNDLGDYVIDLSSKAVSTVWLQSCSSFISCKSSSYGPLAASSPGYYDTQTALMAATKSRQDPSVLAAMIELRADVNARARTGLVALYMCRSPAHVKVLLEHRADMPHYALSGAASFGGPETVQALLSHRCDPNQTEENRYSPLHAIALFSRGNCWALETAKLLLAQRADVNVRTVLWQAVTIIKPQPNLTPSEAENAQGGHPSEKLQF